MATRPFYILLLIMAVTWSCKKKTPTPASTPVTNTQPSPTYSCSTIGTPQDTAFSNGVKYYITANSNTNNTITVYLIKGFSTSTALGISFLQLHKGTACYESSNINATPGVSTFTFVIGPFPQSAIDTATTVSLLQTTIDGNNFTLRDSKLNK